MELNMAVIPCDVIKGTSGSQQHIHSTHKLVIKCKHWGLQADSTAVHSWLLSGCTPHNASVLLPDKLCQESALVRYNLQELQNHTCYGGRVGSFWASGAFWWRRSAETRTGQVRAGWHWGWDGGWFTPEVIAMTIPSNLCKWNPFFQRCHWWQS